MNLLKVAICGVSGNSGQELVRLIDQHPGLVLYAGFSSQCSGSIQNGCPVYPLLELGAHTNEIDCLLLATPPQVSIDIVESLQGSTVTIIDLSGAFRLPADQLSEHYGLSHSLNELKKGGFYGLSPWKTAGKTGLISNPGCYATAALMALIPLIKADIVETQGIIIDAKSGVSGGGKNSAYDLASGAMENNFFPYKVGCHQHVPEIEKQLQCYSDDPMSITLTTHLLPVERGIGMSLYLTPKEKNLLKTEYMDLMKNAYQDAYSDYPLVSVKEIEEGGDGVISLASVIHTPYTEIAYYVKNNQIIVFSYIDNLLKGAASQAIENINAMYGFPLSTGLSVVEDAICY